MDTTSRFLFSIVGMKFRPPADQIIPLLDRGQPLLLVREPSNPHDPNAVSVWVQLGYLPRKDASEVSQAMDLGSLPVARAKYVLGPWPRCEVAIPEESTNATPN